MAPPSKQVANFADAVHDIPDGSVVAFGGFAMPGVPHNLIQALHAQGAKSLTCIANTTGGAQQPRMPDIGMLVENGQVKKVICAFTAATRASDVLPFTKYYEAGEIEAELVPQGTLAERLREAYVLLWPELQRADGTNWAGVDVDRLRADVARWLAGNGGV